MEKLEVVEGIGAALRDQNVSTDIISPSPLYLKPRSAYGPGLFGPWRYDPDGQENPDFVLNNDPFRDARILVAGENFGCGSSRQIAVWCLQDFGFRAVLAPSFADIFSENAFKSGLLVATLPEDDILSLQDELDGRRNGARMTIDLGQNCVTAPSGREIPFEIDSFRRNAYLNGLTELDMILDQQVEITRFQDRLREARPWVWPHDQTEGQLAR